ncbi:hypothetical protein [Pseudarthrobacter sp. NIBRBAC000502770]|uniref:hypothetical protein n=1 Tax=Pseudarthrobacter sp. NIBRBAC000502770 TaxID=2590785 RepID=UPI00114076BC|nr:hypothetical protein [Pseudarthrobacter sp. NIBRBAC000502770]QDG88864.1 hypothetical protein NIBR502770_10540 [Pseudarthrobacter sp. NIBRBAC000502770]
MTIRIETPNRLSVGDQIDHGGGKFVVTGTAVWSDALDNYAYTEALLEPVGGENDVGETGDQ